MIHGGMSYLVPPNRGGTLVVTGLHREVGRALGPLWAPGTLLACLASGRPCFHLWEGSWGVVHSKFWPSPGGARSYRIFAPSGIALTGAGTRRPGKAPVALHGLLRWLACPGSPSVLKEMTATHTHVNTRKVLGPHFSLVSET